MPAVPPYRAMMTFHGWRQLRKQLADAEHELECGRRNVQVFADRLIAAADLDQILEAGRRSPSS